MPGRRTHDGQHYASLSLFVRYFRLLYVFFVLFHILSLPFNSILFSVHRFLCSSEEWLILLRVADLFGTLAVLHLTLTMRSFVSNGICTIPAALKPLNDSSEIHLQNSRVTQENLGNVTIDFKDICEVKQFVKNGIIGRSRNLSCVADFFKGSTPSRV